MRLWRLCASRYPPFDGEGARRVGGRWNSPGLPMVYASQHLSLAVLESLVHYDVAFLPNDLLAHAVDLPDEHITVLDPASLPDGWSDDPAYVGSRQVGDAWLGDGTGLALAVPSAIIAEEYNVLLNPRHPRAEALLAPVLSRPFDFDPRLTA
ncbi:MAG TPA: RES domain-containing protein [Longimicrobiaceae bacterium]|nr:RES domain-containing protein [Longimicrobiaceae bacterium]